MGFVGGIGAARQVSGSGYGRCEQQDKGWKADQQTHGKAPELNRAGEASLAGLSRLAETSTNACRLVGAAASRE
jgi:hypothetical protein